MKKKPAIFLDRDGTMNQDPGFVNEPEQLILYPEVGPELQKLQKADFSIFVVTNQSGVGRGYITEEQLERVNRYMLELLKGIEIKKIYAAFYYDKANNPKYKKNPELRKPAPGMLLQAAREFNIDLTKSFMIGDRASDLEAGKNAGCKSILVLTGQGKSTQKSDGEKADFIAKNLHDAGNWILSQ